MSVVCGPNRLDVTMLTLCECLCSLESVGGESRNGTVKEFETQFVEHYACNIDDPIPRTNKTIKHCLEGRTVWARTNCVSPQMSTLG